MAKRVNFLADFIYTPDAERRISTKYKAGMNGQLVTEECYQKALALGRVELAETLQPGAPRRRRTRK